MTLILKTAPAGLTVTLADAKDHLRIDDTMDDELLTFYVSAAVDWLDGADGQLNRCLLNQTWTLKLPCFDRKIKLPLPPVSAVSEIRYLDSEGVSQILDPAEYRVTGLGAASSPASIRPAYSKSWPSTRTDDEAVEIDFVAGYGADWNSVPDKTKALILITAADFYENREGQVKGVSVSEMKSPALRGLLASCRYKGVI